MAILKVFGEPEPGDAKSKVIGTARAVNVLPNINKAGQLVWVTRPGMGKATPCLPTEYEWTKTEWSIDENNYPFGGPTDEVWYHIGDGGQMWSGRVRMVDNDQDTQRVAELDVTAIPVANLEGGEQTLYINYRNESNAQLRLCVFAENYPIVEETLYQGKVKIFYLDNAVTLKFARFNALDMTKIYLEAFCPSPPIYYGSPFRIPDTESYVECFYLCNRDWPEGEASDEIIYYE